MSDEELLKRAELIMIDAQKRDNPDLLKLMALESLAYSQLVIARNSVPEIVVTGVKDELNEYPGKPRSVVELPRPQNSDEHDTFVKERLAGYERYWNPQKRRYEIEPGWNPTRGELVEDIEKSWESEE